MNSRLNLLFTFSSRYTYLILTMFGIWYHAGLRRSGKSCRLRWMNYLRPNLKHGQITEDEENLIIKLQKQLGNK